jgi:hypothetical protein
MVGIVVLLSVSNMHWVGDLLAFLGGLLLTGYSFLIEKLSLRPEHNSVCSLRAVFGVEWLTMAIEMLIYALLYGHWKSIHFMLPHMATFAYVGLVTTLLPMVTMMVMRRYVNGVMLTFLGTLEPVAGAIFAFFFAHEHFLPLMYLGGVLIVGSLVLQALVGCTGLSRSVRIWWRRFHHFHKVQVQASAPTRRLLSRSSWPQGRRAHILFTQFLSVSEGVDLLTLQRLTGMPCRCVYRLLAFLQKQGYVISYQNHGARYYMLHPSWQVSGHLREVLS